MSTPSTPHKLGIEQKPDGEDEAITRIAAVERELLQRTIDKEQLPSPGHPVPRGQHPKQHGLVRAEFVIADNVPEPLRFGLFQEAGKSFPTWIRFSNAITQDDQKPGAHGMAIKLMAVPGEKLLEREKHAQTHDFLLIDSPVFFIRDAIEYARFEAAVLKTKASWLGVLSLLGYFVTHLSEVFILMKIAKTVSINPLESRYWSTTPYKLGDGAVKYMACPRLHGPPIATETPSVDQLRYAMKRTLDIRDASFDFFVQRQVDPVNQPIEDPTHEWDETAAPFVKAATIHIPRQTFDTEPQMDFCQNLSFNPWHALPDHGPLGGINRVRRAVYLAVSDLRHQKNGGVSREPTPETMPGDIPK